jgi:hypothetical protein
MAKVLQMKSSTKMLHKRNEYVLTGSRVSQSRGSSQVVVLVL